MRCKTLMNRLSHIFKYLQEYCSFKFANIWIFYFGIAKNGRSIQSFKRPSAHLTHWTFEGGLSAEFGISGHPNGE